MKKLILILACISFEQSIAMAADNFANNTDEQLPDINPVEDLANRLNVVKPEQYVPILTDVKQEAHDTAKSMTPKEAEFMMSVQNRLNKDMAKRNNEPEPENIKINPNNAQDVERILTPNIYTYDDVIPDIQ